MRAAVLLVFQDWGLARPRGAAQGASKAPTTNGSSAVAPKPGSSSSPKKKHK